MSKPDDTAAAATPDLDAFAQQLQKQHAALTATFLESQQVAEKAWADHEAASTVLTEFRSKYGHVLAALEKSARVRDAVAATLPLPKE